MMNSRNRRILAAYAMVLVVVLVVAGQGNGRTQRVMWTLLCHEAGYDLDWRRVDGEENDNASRLTAEDRDYSALIDMFKRIARPCDPEQPFNKDFITTGYLRGR